MKRDNWIGILVFTIVCLAWVIGNYFDYRAGHQTFGDLQNHLVYTALPLLGALLHALYLEICINEREKIRREKDEVPL